MAGDADIQALNRTLKDVAVSLRNMTLLLQDINTKLTPKIEPTVDIATKAEAIMGRTSQDANA